MNVEPEFTMGEIIEFLESIKARESPFWGETTVGWQNGKIVWWREAGTKKPSRRGK